jgi:two-component system cell cycle response regulator
VDGFTREGQDAPREGVSVSPEIVPFEAGPPLELSRGVCHLVKEKKPDFSFYLFGTLVKTGLPALCVTRQYPDRVRREHSLRDIRVIWLSHTPGDDYHNPTALGVLTKAICKFIEESGGEAVVLIDGLEYIMVNNGFLQTLMFVEQVNEFVMQRKAIVILPVSPEALEEKELALLERNLEVVEAPSIKMDMETKQVSKLLDTYEGK